MEMQTELKEIMSELGIKRISKIEEIDEIYDYELLLNTNDLSIRKDCEETINIILFDTPIYNSTYLLDTFKEFIDENGELMEHVNVFYCDDFIVYKILFEKYWRKSGVGFNEEDGNGKVMGIDNINRIIPAILVVNGIDEEILIETEVIGVITTRTIERLIEELN